MDNNELENDQLNNNQFENTQLIETETKKIYINKNIILAIIIAILLVFAVILFFIFKNPKKIDEIGSQKFNSGDQSVSISTTSNFGFEIQHLDDYVLSINSAKYSSSVFVSRVTSANIRDIKKYVEADKTDYVSKFSNISEVSEVTETTVSGLTAYNYHFNYSSNMYVDVYIVPKDEYLYIIDFNFNKDKQDLIDHLPDMLKSIVIN